MNLKELWIGDWLLLKKSGRKGKFLGITKEGKARVQIAKKVIITTPSNLMHIPDPIEEDSTQLHDVVQKQHSVAGRSRPTAGIHKDTIDLHLEKLDPENSVTKENALDYQILRSRQFIEQAIENKRFSITIIHGKGTGILKLSIQHLLEEFPEVRFSIPAHQGGATEVIFNYSFM